MPAPRRRWHCCRCAPRLIVIAVVACCIASCASAQELPTAPTCADLPFRLYPYCDASLSPAERARDLVGRMSPLQRLSQLSTFAVPLPRLAVPKYQWRNEALHGVKSEGCTSFPQIIGMGATFDRELWLEMAVAISTEARAIANGPLGEQWTSFEGGLTYFSPDINIFRDPRWGRGQEVPGEDPFATGEYATAFVQGLQGHPSDPLYDPRYVKIVATCKHFAAYSLEQGDGYSRHSFNAIVNERDLAETYLPAFETCVREGKVRSVMCAYNRVNGVPMCANGAFLNDKLRGEWGFKGYVVSDCGAVADIYYNHNFTQTVEQTCAASIENGCDNSCILFHELCPRAVESGDLSEDAVTLAAERLFEQRFALGMFDPPEQVSYRQIAPDRINLPETVALARRAAGQTIVLLKNEGNLLPLSSSARIAVVGPHGDATRAMLGNYYGLPTTIVSPIEGIRAALTAGGSATFTRGCEIQGNDTSGFDEALGAMRAADVVVLMIGINQDIEREGQDRSSLVLPGVQEDLVRLAVSSGRPVVGVLLNGGPIDISLLKAQVPAILEAWYPGEQGGNGIADVLFGKVNPSAKLDVTIYPREFTGQIAMTEMDMRAFPGRTYRFYTGTPVYPYGFGLSYTNFTYEALRLADDAPTLTTEALAARGTLPLCVRVTNTGARAGAEVVLAFVAPDLPDAPLRTLVEFTRLHDLAPGESRDVVLRPKLKQLAYVDAKGRRALVPATYRFEVGTERLEVALSGEAVTV